MDQGLNADNATPTKIDSKFDQPIEVTDVDLAFPAQGAELIPSYDLIPDIFKHGSNVFREIAKELIQTGSISSQTNMVLKEGIDPEKVRRHTSVVIGSFAPKHEHKEAGVAYLLSRWFEDSSKKE